MLNLVVQKEGVEPVRVKGLMGLQKGALQMWSGVNWYWGCNEKLVLGL
jgi:hypothetical protein